MTLKHARSMSKLCGICEEFGIWDHDLIVQAGLQRNNVEPCMHARWQTAGRLPFLVASVASWEQRHVEVAVNKTPNDRWVMMSHYVVRYMHPPHRACIHVICHFCIMKTMIVCFRAYIYTHTLCPVIYHTLWGWFKRQWWFDIIPP